MKNYRFVFLALLLIAVSCEGLFKTPSWESEGLFPLLESEVDLFDRVNNNLFQVNDEGIFTLQYSQKLTELRLDTLARISDEIVENGFNLPFGTVIFAPGQLIIDDTNTTRFDLNNLRLTETILLEGKLALEVVSNIKEQLFIEYNLPSSEIGGNNFSFQSVLPASIGSVITIRDTFQLNDIKLGLRGQAGNSFNRLPSTLRVFVDPNGSNVQLSAGDFVLIRTRILDAEPFYIKGEFLQQTLEIESNNEELDIFGNLISGGFDLKEVEIALQISNGIGADLQAQVKNLSTTNETTGETVELISPLINGNINISRAKANGSDLSSLQKVQNTVAITQDNSNIDELIEIAPTSYRYGMRLRINPLGNISGSNDFFFLNENLNVRMLINIPMHINAQGLVIRDTAEFDFGNKEDNEAWVGRVSDGFLNANIENYYPFDARLELKILDANKNELRTLTSPNYVAKAGNFSTDFEFISSEKSMIPMLLNTEIIDDLYEAKYMEVIFTMSTPDGVDAMKIFEGQKLKLKLIGDFIYAVN